MFHADAAIASSSNSAPSRCRTAVENSSGYAITSASATEGQIKRRITSCPSGLAHQALRPEPEETQEQRIHHDVLVNSADPVGRHRLDHPDQQARDQRTRHAAEPAERYRDEGDNTERLADGRRNIKEGSDRSAGTARTA